jgi:hypothetical protein
MKILICFTLLMFFLFGCDKAFLDSGPIETQTISITEPYSSIDFKNTFDVVLVQDTVSKALVTCGANLQDKVSVKVENGVLIINQFTSQDWSRKYGHIRLELHILQPMDINVREPINLTNTDTLRGEHFGIIDWGKMSQADVAVNVRSVSISMSSDNFGVYKLKGNCQSAYLWGWGSCFVYADSLKAQSCYVLQRSIGDVYVNVVNNLTVSLEQTGNVYYRGTPTLVTEKQTSSGKLISLNTR